MRSCAKPAINVTEWVASTQELIKISPSCHCMPLHLSHQAPSIDPRRPASAGSAAVCWRVSWAESRQDRWGCFIISKLIGAVFTGCTWNPSSFCHLIQSVPPHEWTSTGDGDDEVHSPYYKYKVVKNTIPRRDMNINDQFQAKAGPKRSREELASRGAPTEESSVSQQTVQDFIITVPWSHEGILYKK